MILFELLLFTIEEKKKTHHWKSKTYPARNDREGADWFLTNQLNVGFQSG
jgi:hypothetical protein